MLQVIIRLIGVLMLLAGVILVYDARIITKKVFDFGDQNEATSGFKILGAILAMVGGLIVFFC
ncbi:unknown [Clostridium sp. CAG:356]|jgi:hypothetical protein|nr:MAG: hypothetical protein BHW02_05530 [Clostridium sp. 28_12]CDD37343.1 unknown [Clostridium sp. CAG:356]